MHETKGYMLVSANWSKNWGDIDTEKGAHIWGLCELYALRGSFILPQPFVFEKDNCVTICIFMRNGHVTCFQRLASLITVKIH